MKDLITDAKITFVDEEEEYETPLKVIKKVIDIFYLISLGNDI